jgi:hypothetical protein
VPSHRLGDQGGELYRPRRSAGLVFWIPGVCWCLRLVSVELAVCLLFCLSGSLRTPDEHSSSRLWPYRFFTTPV